MASSLVSAPCCFAVPLLAESSLFKRKEINRGQSNRAAMTLSAEIA